MVSHRGRICSQPEQFVLILIVMDNGLSPYPVLRRGGGEQVVLILIVMDNGLSRRYAGTVAVLTLS